MAAEPVVVVHGLWCGPWIMAILARRLAGCGFVPRCFGYPTVRRSPAENGRALAGFVAALPGERFHVVGHSLGGLVVLHWLAAGPDPRLGRVVLMGTPFRGAVVARRLLHLPGGRGLLGRSVEAGLLGGAPAPPAGVEIGVLAGDMGIGLGTLLGGAGRPSDGVVAVAETELPGAAARRVLHLNHTGLLLSKRAAAEVCHFLRHGRFGGSADRG